MIFISLAFVFFARKRVPKSILVIIISFLMVLPIAVGYLSKAGGMGFVYNGTHLSIWTGWHVVENYDVSRCEKEWFDVQNRTIRRVAGTSLPGRLITGRLAVNGLGEGIGVVIGRNKWGLFINVKR